MPSISGTLFGRSRPCIVRLDDYHLDLIPEGEVFLYSNNDRPRIIGKVGSLLGKGEISIGEMSMDLLWACKLWWMAPLMVMLLLLSILVVFTEGSALAPFIYALF